MQLARQLVCDDGGEGREEGRQEHADVAHVDGQVKEAQNVEDGSRGDHEPGVDGAADDPPQRIPSAIVKPIVKAVEALVGQILGGPVIEVGIELVNHGLVAKHGEETDGER